MMLMGGVFSSFVARHDHQPGVPAARALTSHITCASLQQLLPMPHSVTVASTSLTRTSSSVLLRRSRLRCAEDGIKRSGDLVEEQ